MGTCLKYWDLVYDVIMNLFHIIFRIFNNQQNCTITCFNLIKKTFIRQGLHPILVEVRNCCMFSETHCILHIIDKTKIFNVFCFFTVYDSNYLKRDNFFSSTVQRPVEIIRYPFVCRSAIRPYVCLSVYLSVNNMLFLYLLYD